MDSSEERQLPDTCPSCEREVRQNTVGGWTDPGEPQEFICSLNAGGCGSQWRRFPDGRIEILMRARTPRGG